MRENFLHYLWKHKKFDIHNLRTSAEEHITIINVGNHNYNSGPDFFNAQLTIDGQRWVGNVEIHIKSSDWFLHHHETDKAYDNVILHVVWEHDVDVFRKNNTRIPTLQLKQYISKKRMNSYFKLFSKEEKWINCEKNFKDVDDFIMYNWLERLFFERLEDKVISIEALLESNNSDWEAILFKQLMKSFGSKVNGDAFLSISNSLSFSIIRKLQYRQYELEAMLFGQAGLLNEDIQDPYYLKLQHTYAYLSQKFNVSNQGKLPVLFFRLRPSNFPTIRLSQLAVLYATYQNLFSKIIETQTRSEFYALFDIKASDFWDAHYTFNKVSKTSNKHITKSFIDLILVNAIIPIKFYHARYHGKSSEEEITLLASTLDSERNSIVDKYFSLKPIHKSALYSQALLQLKTKYCDKNKCLQCAIGNALLD